MAVRLNEVENQMGEDRPGSWSSRRRTEALRMLHEETSSLFARSPGFGAIRTARPDLRRLDRYEDTIVPVDQPGPHETSADTTSDGPIITNNETYRDMHLQSL